MTLRYIRAAVGVECTDYSGMLNHMRQTPLYKLGDAILVWVNESDFLVLNPTDVETEAKERAEYERLRIKFGFEK